MAYRGIATDSACLNAGLRAGMVAVALLLVTGCQLPQQSAKSATQQSALPADASAIESNAAQNAKAQTSPVPDLASTDALIGLPDRRIAAFFGEPKRVRKESPAEVWQYAKADCVLDVYLYRTNGELAVTYVEARDSTAVETPAEHCFKTLMRASSL